MLSSAPYTTCATLAAFFFAIWPKVFGQDTRNQIPVSEPAWKNVLLAFTGFCLLIAAQKLRSIGDTGSKTFKVSRTVFVSAIESVQRMATSHTRHIILETYVGTEEVTALEHLCARQNVTTELVNRVGWKVRDTDDADDAMSNEQIYSSTHIIMPSGEAAISARSLALRSVLSTVMCLLSIIAKIILLFASISNTNWKNALITIAFCGILDMIVTLYTVLVSVQAATGAYFYRLAVITLSSGKWALYESINGMLVRKNAIENYVSGSQLRDDSLRRKNYELGKGAFSSSVLLTHATTEALAESLYREGVSLFILVLLAIKSNALEGVYDAVISAYIGIFIDACRCNMIARSSSSKLYTKCIESVALLEAGNLDNDMIGVNDTKESVLDLGKKVIFLASNVIEVPASYNDGKDKRIMLTTEVNPFQTCREFRYRTWGYGDIDKL